MNKTAARLALGFSLLGLGASLAAAVTHYRLLTEPGYASVCDVNATISCTQVYSSQYGAVGGVSVAVVGAIGFGFTTLLALAGLVGGPQVRENVPGYLFGASTLALSIVIYLGYASFVLLGLVCVFCLGTYVATAGLFLVSGAGASMPLTSLPGRAAADLKTLASWPAGAVVAVLFVVVSVASVIMFPRDARPVDAPTLAGNATEEERAAFEEWYAGQRRIPVDIPAEGASVLVVKFNDYQCPWCARTWEDYKGVFARFEASHPGAVKLVVLDFPLEPECNANVTSTVHEGACEAAAAVRLAREHGRGEAMEAYLYTHQPDMTSASVRQWAREIGQVTDFDARYAAVLEAVKADVTRGSEMGVRSTPTFIIAGTVVEGGLPPHLFEHAIDFELDRAKR